MNIAGQNLALLISIVFDLRRYLVEFALSRRLQSILMNGIRLIILLLLLLPLFYPSFSTTWCRGLSDGILLDNGPFRGGMTILCGPLSSEETYSSASCVYAWITHRQVAEIL